MKTETEVTRILTDLIGFDTTSRHSNLALIAYAESLLADFGVGADLVYDEGGGKANLFATLGGGDAPGVVLSGHTDVVPVDGQNWRTDPFAVEIAGGKLFGRGSCDMKGFIAVCLAHVDTILRAKLKTPVHLALTYDEEVGCLGVGGLLAELARREIRPRACIVGEPTSMGVVRAHKGMLSKRCRVRGRAGHSSLPHLGVNAVGMAAEVISHIHKIAERVAREGPFDHGFVPPHTTLHAGVVHGGTVNNVIANECEFIFEIRNLPKQVPLELFEEVRDFAAKKLLPKMRAVSDETGFDWETLSDYPGLDTQAGAEVVSLVSGLLDGDDAPGKVCYGTEGGLYDRAGIPAVVCGPGSIEQAHKADEYVDLAQLARGEKFVRDLVDALD